MRIECNAQYTPTFPSLASSNICIKNLKVMKIFNLAAVVNNDFIKNIALMKINSNILKIEKRKKSVGLQLRK